MTGPGAGESRQGRGDDPSDVRPLVTPVDRLVAPVSGGWREWACVCLGFGALTVLLTFPLAVQIGRVGRIDNGDGRFSIWNVAWVARTLVLDPLHVFDANIFYPHTGTLAYSESNLGAGALAVPVYWATHNAYAAHNFVLLLSFVFSAMGTYYFAPSFASSSAAALSPVASTRIRWWAISASTMPTTLVFLDLESCSATPYSPSAKPDCSNPSP